MDGKFIHRVTLLGGYDVYYVDPAGHEKKVSPVKPDYTKWITDGNIPQVFPYSGIPAPQETLESLRLQAVNRSVMRRTHEMNKGFTFNVNGNDLVFDTMPQSRELLNFAAALVQTKSDTYEREIVLKDGSFTVLTKAQILALSMAMLPYGEVIYDNWKNDYKKILIATEEQLKIYLSTWVI